MELQEPILKVLVTELRFKPSPRFIEGRGRFAEQVMEKLGLDTWQLNEGTVTLSQLNAPGTVIVATPQSVVTSFEDRDPDECVEDARTAFEVAIDCFSPPAVAQIGVRSQWMLPADDFEELNRWMVEELSAGSRSLFDPVGHQPSDSGWVFEFRDQQPEHVLRLGPMTAKQGTEQFFRDKDIARYPEQFLFMDLDRMLKRDLDLPTQGMESWQTNFERNLDVARRIAVDLRSRL